MPYIFFMLQRETNSVDERITSSSLISKNCKQDWHVFCTKDGQQHKGNQCCYWLTCHSSTKISNTSKRLFLHSLLIAYFHLFCFKETTQDSQFFFNWEHCQKWYLVATMCKKHTKFIANFNHKELNFGAMCALVSTRTIGYLGKK